MFVAVDSKRGPHVTAELFVEVNGRLWTFTGADTLKVRALRRTPQAGVLIGQGTDAFIVASTARIIDAVDPLAAATSGVALDIPRVSAAFATRHSLEVAGGAADYAAGSFGLVPGRRVLLAFEPTAVALVRDGRLAEADGWRARRSAADEVNEDDQDDGEEVEIDLDAIPASVRDLVRNSEATLGWYATGGPLALPARWSFDESSAWVDAALFATTGCAPESRAALTIDEWMAPGPGGKRGVMLRGEGRASTDETASDRVRITIAADRAVVWNGMETESVSGIRDFPADAGHTASVSDPNKDPKKETRAG